MRLFVICITLVIFPFWAQAQFGNTCQSFDSSACYSSQPFPPINFSIVKKYSSTENTTIYHAPLVIDVNGDCVPELLMPGTTNFENGTNTSDLRVTSGIRILNSLNGQTIFNLPTARYAWTAAASFVAADVNQDGQIEIIVAAADHSSNPSNHRARLICYNTTGTILWV